MERTLKLKVDNNCYIGLCLLFQVFLITCVKCVVFLVSVSRLTVHS